MKTFVIFDRKTGAVLQTHVQSGDEQGGSDDLLRTARPEAKAGTVGLLEVEGVEPGRNYRVDLKTRKLVLDKGTKRKAGSGGAHLLPVGGDAGSVRTEVLNLGERKR